MFVASALALLAVGTVLAQEQASPTPKHLSPDETKGYISDLNSPDAATRLATFEKMIDSGNPMLAELGLQTAFGGKDPTLRTVAFRAAFKGVSVFHVDLELKPDATEETKKKLSDFLNGSDINNVEYDYYTGKFYDKYNPSFGGSINGLVITFHAMNCSGTLENKKGTQTFVGDVNCYQYKYLGKFSLR